MFFLAKYNTQVDIRFPMVKRGVVDLAVTGDWTPATGDTKISLDGGTFANTTNNPAIIAGAGAVGWKLTLAANELTGAEINVQIVDSATKAVEDQFLIIYTYGNASAKYVIDFSDAVRFGLTSLPAAAAAAAGGLYTRGTGAGQINQTVNGSIDSNVVQWIGTAASTPTVAGVPNVNVKTWNDLTTVALPLAPTTAGRALDVSTGGEAGLDWANIGSPTTTVGLTNTSILSGVSITSVTGTVTTVTNLTNAPTVGDFTAAMKTSLNALSALDATISSRLAPAGTLAAVTNLTNAPTAGDFTATMKTSLNALSALDATISSRLASAAYTTAPAAAAIADAVWDETLAGHLSAGSTGTALNAAGSTGDPWATTLPGPYGDNSAGKILGTNLDAAVSTRTELIDLNALSALDVTISSRLASANYVAPLNASGTRVALGLGSANLDTQLSTISAKTDLIPASPITVSDIPTIVDIADAVWNETLADHLSAGSTGTALNAAGSSGDPWATTLPGPYGDNSAGKILGTNLDTTISSRFATSGYSAPLDESGTRLALGLSLANLDSQLSAINDIPTNAELIAAFASADDITLSAIAALNNLSEADIRLAIGLASANLDAQFATLSGGEETVVTAAEIADAVWNETLTDHLSAGSTGTALNAAGSTGDPWATTLPGLYGDNSAGKILGTNLDAAVSTRSSLSAADIWTTTPRTLTADPSGVTTLLGRIASALTITGGKVDVNDKTDFALVSTYDKTFSNISDMVEVDPWSTELSGHYTDHQAGFILAKMDIGAATDSIVVIPGAPPNLSLCRVYGYIETIDNQPAVGAEITFKLLFVAGAKSERLVSGNKVLVQTDNEGKFTIDLQRNDKLTPAGSKYKVTSRTLGFNAIIELTTDTFDLSSIVNATPRPRRW